MPGFADNDVEDTFMHTRHDDFKGQKRTRQSEDRTRQGKAKQGQEKTKQDYAKQEDKTRTGQVM